MSTLLITAGAALTMSTREIGELTGSSHDNVLKTVRRLMAEGVVSGNETPYIHPQNGQTYAEIRLSFRDTMVVVSGYSADLRARIIDRWQELEAGAAPALNLRQPAQMLAVAMQLAEMCQEQQAQLAAQAPRVAFAEAVGASEGSMTTAEAAKVLNIGPRKLLDFMREHGVLMKNDLPFQLHIDYGRFEVVPVPFKDREGRDRMRMQTRVTPRGLTFLQQRLAKASATQGA